MSVLTLPEIQRLVTRAKGLNAIYDLINTRLTATRAGYLDNLVDLTGPVALQSVLGQNTDPANFTSTVFAAIKALDADVKNFFSGGSQTTLAHLSTALTADFINSTGQVVQLLQLSIPTGVWLLCGMVTAGSSSSVVSASPAAVAVGATFSLTDAIYHPNTGFGGASMTVTGQWSLSTTLSGAAGSAGQPGGNLLASLSDAGASSVPLLAIYTPPYSQPAVVSILASGAVTCYAAGTNLLAIKIG